MVIGFLCHILSVFFFLFSLYLWVRFFNNKHKVQKLRKSFPLFLEGLRHSMIAGSSFVKSLESITPYLPTHFKKEIMPLIHSIHKGSNLEQALLKLKINKLIPEFHTFSLIMPILLKNGSDISPFLRKLEQQLKTELEFQEKIKTQSRHVSIQAILCSVLPWLALLGFLLFEPELVQASFLNSVTQKIYLCALGLNVLALVLINRWVSHPPHIKEFPWFLNALSLIIETGQSFLQAFYYVLPILSSHLKNKFKNILQTLLTTHNRQQSLERFLKKEKDPHIERFLFILAQSLHRGSSLSGPLKNLSEDLYFEHTQNLEKQKQNLYFKLLIPLFLFILPSVFLVIFAPLLLSLTTNL